MSSAERSPYSLADLLELPASAPGNSSRLSVRRRACGVAVERRRAPSSVSGGDADRDVAAREHLGAERLGPAAGQVAELARHEADDRVRDVVVLRVLREVGRVGVRRGEVRARGRRRPSTTGVTFGGRARGCGRPRRTCPRCSSKSSARPSAIACWRRLESWPPGISWWYTRPVGPGRPDSNGLVEVAHGLPVRLEVAHGLQRDAGVALGVRERGDQRRQATAGSWCPPSARWRRRPRPRPRALAASSVASWPPAVSCVCTCTGRSKRSRRAVDELRRRRRPQQPRHVLDREDVRAGVDDLLGEPQVVVERVEVLGGVEQVAGVADARPRRRRCRSRAPRRSPGASGSTSLSASKMRKMSTPVAAASRTKASVDLGRVRACSRRCCGRAAASGSAMFGSASRRAASRSHGSSPRKRSATS